MDTVHENDAKPRANPGVTMGGYTWPGNLGNLLDPGIEPTYFALPGRYFTTEPPGKLVRETDTRPITLEINPEMPGLCIRRGVRLMNTSFGFYLHSRY